MPTQASRLDSSALHALWIPSEILALIVALWRGRAERAGYSTFQLTCFALMFASIVLMVGTELYSFLPNRNTWSLEYFTKASTKPALTKAPTKLLKKPIYKSSFIKEGEANRESDHAVKVVVDQPEPAGTAPN